MATYAQRRAIGQLMAALGITPDLRGSGAPTDGVTGKNVARIGDTYVDTATGNHYYNKGTVAAPVWKLVTTAA